MLDIKIPLTFSSRKNPGEQTLLSHPPNPAATRGAGCTWAVRLGSPHAGLHGRPSYVPVLHRGSSPATQPGQMAHLACPRLISQARLPALKPPSLANKVRKALQGAGEGTPWAAAGATASILVFIDLEEQVATPQRAEGTHPGGPRGRSRTETSWREPTRRHI